MVPPLIPPPLDIRGLIIDPPLILAPMAGLTHTCFRRLVVEFGGFGALFTEMLSARSLRCEDPDSSPFLMRTAREAPLFHQVLASTPEEVATGITVLRGIGAEAFDLNFGCPAPDIRRRGGGSRLMERAGVASAIVEAARRAAGELPLSAKIRLGETLDEPLLLDFARMLEEGGVDLIHVHARLRGEPYGRRPRWDWIGKVKNAVRVPVTGNGSIFSAEDARACLAASGCDGLMIGRGAATKPWIFREIAREVWGRPLDAAEPDRREVYRAFARNLNENFPPEKRLGRLKEFTHYFALNYTFGHTLASKVQAARTMETALSGAEDFFALMEDGRENA